MSYEHAQDMLDHPEKTFSAEELPPISSPWKSADLSRRVNSLQRVAVNLRKGRVESGALRLDQAKLAFKMDKETGMPHVRYLRYIW